MDKSEMTDEALQYLDKFPHNTLSKAESAIKRLALETADGGIAKRLGAYQAMSYMLDRVCRLAEKALFMATDFADILHYRFCVDSIEGHDEYKQVDGWCLLADLPIPETSEHAGSDVTACRLFNAKGEEI